MDFRFNYEKNRRQLTRYRWWLYAQLLPYEDLPVRPVEIRPNCYTIVGNENSVLVEQTATTTRPFFRDLTKPIFIENEFNTYHFQYLNDNVRASEDFGGDNHIYLHYDSWKKFYFLLQIADITPYLKDEKYIFLIGGDINLYPIDFKKCYGIDYEEYIPKPWKIEDIKRLIVHTNPQGFCGHEFFSGVTDGHENLLTVRGFGGFAGFPYIYSKILKGMTVNEACEQLKRNVDPNVFAEFHYVFRKYRNKMTFCVPTFEQFFIELDKLFPIDYRPSYVEWFKAFFLAYNNAYRGESMNRERIAPAIMLNTHPISVQLKSGDFFSLYKQFKYLRIVSIIRRQIMCVGSCQDLYGKLHLEQYLNYLHNALGCIGKSQSLDIKGNYYGTCFYLDESDEFLPCRGMIRFEDLKLESRATLEALCDFIDIPFSERFLHTTENGNSSAMNMFKGRMVRDFDPAPVYNPHELGISPFDYYRFELVGGDWYKDWGYKPLYHNDGMQYTKDEIRALFALPFKAERITYTKLQRDRLSHARKIMMQLLESWLDNPRPDICEGKVLVPVRWIKPKKKFMIGKLYE